MSNKSISALLLLLIFIVGCNSSKTYEGHSIEFDYAKVEEVNAGNWIKIDGRKFTHVRTMKEGDSLQYSLPSTYIVVDSTSERTYGTPLSPRNIGIYLVRYLQFINREELSQDEGKYRFGDQGVLSVTGKLVLQKTDSSLIRLETTKDYPVPIKVLN